MWYSIPGMAADARLFSRLAGHENWHHLDWSACSDAQTMSQMAETFIARAGIADGDTIVSCSLGGMVALEILRRRRLRRLYLISSCYHPAEISTYLLRLWPFAPGFPWPMVQYPAKVLATLTGIQRCPADMLFASSAGQIARMCVAIGKWQGYDGDRRVIRRIHGRWDPIIRLRRTSGRVAIVPGFHLTPLESPGCIDRAIATWEASSSA